MEGGEKDWTRSFSFPPLFSIAPCFFLSFSGTSSNSSVGTLHARCFPERSNCEKLQHVSDHFAPYGYT